MAKNQNPTRYRDDVREVTRDSSLGGLVVLFFVVGALVVGFGIWGLTVWLSPVTGAGNVHRDVNDAKNQEAWSARYNGEYNRLLADKQQVRIMSDSYRSTKSEKDRIDLQGAVLNCQSDVAAYNADTQNVLGRKWLPSGLPQSVDATEVCGHTLPGQP